MFRTGRRRSRSRRSRQRNYNHDRKPQNSNHGDGRKDTLRRESTSTSYSSSRSLDNQDSRGSSDSPSSSADDACRDDEIIHFDWYKGLYLGDTKRYEIRRKLGDGTFGRVLECIDHTLQCRVAVKVIRDVRRYIENAKVEARILEKVNDIRRNSSDHSGSRGVVRLYDIFTHKDRFFCMSFERLGKTLYEVIQMNNYCGFYLWDIQQIATELIDTLDFIHTRCGLTHTDIKMENIMLCGDEFQTTSAPIHTGRTMTYHRPILVADQTKGRHKSIRLIDFGNGVFRGKHHSTIINTRQYRSPEVILEQGWDEKSDMWSIGCVIGEMWTGELIFPTHSNLEHLAMIERITGEFFDPDYLSYSPPDVRERFSDPITGLLRWPENCESRESFKTVNDCVPLTRLLRDEPDLLDLISKLLRIDPRRRYSARRAIEKCEFFQQSIDRHY